MKTRVYLFVLFIALVVACPARSQAAQAPARQHPYLFFTKADIPKLQERVKDPLFAAIWERVQATALGGGRGGDTSSVMCACIAYNLTGDKRFADAGIGTAMYLTDPSWPWIRPSFEIRYCDLDMASRALAVTYAYDMLYDAMTEQQRIQCREALRANVFAPYLEAHELYDAKMRAFTDKTGHWEWWTTCYFNWNSWVNGGIGLAGLALMDETPEGAKVVEMARASLKCMHDELNQGDAEAGGCDEGPMYWQVVAHAVRFYAALERIMNTDDGFFELPGTQKTMQYGIAFVAPDGKWVNFSDCPDRLVLDPPSELYFLANRYNQPQYMRHLDDNSADWHARPFAILWRPAIATPPADPRPPISLFRDIEWAVLSSHGLFLPFKGGDLAANHGQWDANTMMLWVNGERMLNDPGYGNLATADHNSLLVNNIGQHLNQEPFPALTRPRSYGGHSNSFARILKCGAIGADQYLVCDASSCYAHLADRYQRHVILADEGYVVVFDDVKATADSAEFKVNWHTMLATSTTPEGQGVITGDKEKLYLAVAADRPYAGSLAATRFDWGFGVGSNGPSKEWRLFSVLAPNTAPKVTSAFTADRASVTVNGKEYAFERAADGAYRYTAGEPVPPK